MHSLLDQPDIFFEALRNRLNDPLPGEPAQNRMTSRARISTGDYLKQRPDHRTSAVMLPLFPHNGTIYTALIRRPSYDGMHSGQLALPGGKADETDASPAHTALREMKEEVGVELDETNVLGALTPVFIPVSNFLVHTFVAKLPAKPAWQPDPREVESVLEFPLSLLADHTVKTRRKITIGKNMFIEAPCYLVDGQVLWGATAMMFSELEALLGGE
jgi:8-oxo-dGTP pyrophosphatase MutT (NUDIX family)